MRQRIRTFVAVNIESVITELAAEVIQRMRSVPVDVKWVEPDNMHLTLKFLGDIDISETYEVCKAVQRAVGSLEAFDLELRGVGAFPSIQRPRTIWLGAGEGEEQMVELAGGVDVELAKVGYRKEGRRFQPHLTLGRVRNERGPAMAELTRILQEYAELEIGRTPIDEVIIYSSTLTRSGPVYEPIGRATVGSAR